jgi:hypothetical protein
LLDLTAGTWVDNSKFFTLGTNWVGSAWTRVNIAFAFVLGAAVVFTVCWDNANFTEVTDWSGIVGASLHDFWWTNFFNLLWNTLVNLAADISRWTKDSSETWLTSDWSWAWSERDNVVASWWTCHDSTWVGGWCPLFTDLSGNAGIINADFAFRCIDALAVVVNKVFWTEATFSVMSHGHGRVDLVVVASLDDGWTTWLEFHVGVACNWTELWCSPFNTFVASRGESGNWGTGEVVVVVGDVNVLGGGWVQVSCASQAVDSVTGLFEDVGGDSLSACSKDRWWESSCTQVTFVTFFNWWWWWWWSTWQIAIDEPPWGKVWNAKSGAGFVDVEVVTSITVAWTAHTFGLTNVLGGCLDWPVSGAWSELNSQVSDGQSDSRLTTGWNSESSEFNKSLFDHWISWLDTGKRDNDGHVLVQVSDTMSAVVDLDVFDGGVLSSVHADNEVTAEVTGKCVDNATIFLSVVISIECWEGNTGVTFTDAFADVGGAASVFIVVSNWLLAAWAWRDNRWALSFGAAEGAIFNTVAVGALVRSDNLFTNSVDFTAVSAATVSAFILVAAFVESSDSNQSLVGSAGWCVTLVRVTNTWVSWTAWFGTVVGDHDLGSWACWLLVGALGWVTDAFVLWTAGAFNSDHLFVLGADWHSDVTCSSDTSDVAVLLACAVRTW